MIVLNMQHVRHEYGRGNGTVTALHDVDLSIHQGELVAVWGPSGSGKSTLCNLAGGLSLPQQGVVRIHGRDLRSLTDDEQADHRNRHVGFVFQQFNLLPVLSAMENVTLPLRLSGTAPRKAVQQATDLFHALDIADLANVRPDQLSGGQRQRVAIARALITRPAIVIADEPTANLDSENADRILALMLSLNRAQGVTFLFATHDERLLQKIPRNIHLVDGRIEHDSGSRP